VKSEIGPELTLEQLAAHVAGALWAAGIEAVLTGGAVVSIYAHNAFESLDLDFITAAGRREPANAMTAQAVAIARAQSVKLSEVHRWSIAAGKPDGFEIFRARLKAS
jgi:hypothetical protein